MYSCVSKVTQAYSSVILQCWISPNISIYILKCHHTLITNIPFIYHCRSNTRVVSKHWLIQENNIWIFQLKFLILGSNNYLKYYILHTCTFVLKEILLSYKWLMKIAQECTYYHHLICNIFLHINCIVFTNILKFLGLSMALSTRILSLAIFLAFLMSFSVRIFFLTHTFYLTRQMFKVAFL